MAKSPGRCSPAVVVVSLLLGSCGGQRENGSFVVMTDNQFSGAVARVPVGTRVIFLNLGRSGQNATAMDGNWKVADVAPESGAEGHGGEVVFDKPGVYRYRCTYHGTPDGKGMSGTIVVGDVEYSARTAGVIPAVATPSGRT